MSPILQGLANGSVRGYGGYLPLGPSTAFESIASASGTGSSGTITFSSIPSTYQHLQIRALMKDTNSSGIGTGNMLIRFNSDTGSNYARHSLAGDGATTVVSGLASQTAMISGDSVAGGSSTIANTHGVAIIDIHDYASTTKNKTMRIFSGADFNSTQGYVNLVSGLWMSTSAVTSISFVLSANSWTTTTQFALYGIKGA